MFPIPDPSLSGFPNLSTFGEQRAGASHSPVLQCPLNGRIARNCCRMSTSGPPRPLPLCLDRGSAATLLSFRLVPFSRRQRATINILRQRLFSVSQHTPPISHYCTNKRHPPKTRPPQRFAKKGDTELTATFHWLHQELLFPSFLFHATLPLDLRASVSVLQGNQRCLQQLKLSPCT